VKFFRWGPDGAERPGVEADGSLFDLSGVVGDIDGAFLSADPVAVTGAALAGGLPRIEASADLRFGAPIAKPGAVVCVGMNYAAHAAESGAAPPAEPVIFFKHPNTVVGPDDAVILPPGTTKVDWEVELAIVIGARAAYLESDEAALACIAGYTISNDVSERDWQIERSGGQWSKGKNAETFNPLGPRLTTRDELGDGLGVRIWSTVNGEARQDSSTSDMIFSPVHIVRHLSQFMVLEPGDVVNTGTPEGVALSGRFSYHVEGDVIELGIEGIGVQRQTVIRR
jgi:2,4-diketo-3-deoxy-L-fuconate hydrolase